MAKDTEKLIRQLSLISYLMAERRPVTALEIRRDVEGYSAMNEDAFARRFYADRAELESLGIQLTVDRPADAAAEQESYSLRSESFHLPAIEFTDEELAALQTALHLLDGEFAYAEPLRLALQQITWGRPSPLRAPEQQRSVALGITASAGGHEFSARLAKVETAIFRQKTITFDYYSMERDELGGRRVDPYHLLFQGGEFYLLGHAHERKAIRVFRLSRIRGKVAYATKAEHDFRRPADFDPRAYANRTEWQLGEQRGVAEIPAVRADRVADRAPLRPLRGDPAVDDEGSGDRVFYPLRGAADACLMGAGPGEHARLVSPPELAEELAGRLELLERRHAESPLADHLPTHPGEGDSTGGPRGAAQAQPTKSRRRRGGQPTDPEASSEEPRRVEAAIRPERFARLVTLAGILIHAGREGRRESLADLQERLQLSEEELSEDIDVLNVVNFGGGSYVLYAEIIDTEEGAVG